MDEKIRAALVADVRRQMLLEDVGIAERLALPYLKHAKGILLMGQDYESFGGVGNPTGASAAGFGEMSNSEKSVWVACKLWAVCQKIKSDKSPGAAAGQTLDKYKGWLKDLESHRKKSAKGGESKRKYSDDLNMLIKEVISTLKSEKIEIIKNEVFKKLQGEARGVIEKIELKEDKLLVSWSSEDARNPDRTESIGKSAISKRVSMIISRT